jgi:hypothetical protein
MTPVENSSSELSNLESVRIKKDSASGRKLMLIVIVLLALLVLLLVGIFAADKLGFLPAVSPTPTPTVVHTLIP